MTFMMYSGIVSLTQKALPVYELMDLIKTSGLTAVEWSANCHVPETDPDNARAVRARCDELGIRIASYGTYYYLGQGMEFRPLLDTALILGAPNLRIWAGKKNSEDVSDKERSELVAEAQKVADMAAVHGLTVSFEYHRNTLTNNADSAVRLMKEIDRPNIRLYWQPNQFEDVTFNIEALTKVLPYVTNVHVFCWEGGNRFPLADGIAAWNEYIRILKTSGHDHALLLEFVKDDKKVNVISDAAALNALIRNDESFMLRQKTLHIPYSSDLSALKTPVADRTGRLQLKNRLTIHPMEGFDSTDDGSPGELTLRRYRRFAASGAALIWLEATAVLPEARSNAHQLWLHKENKEAFRALREQIRRDAPDVPVIIQLTHSGRFSAPTGKSAPLIAYHNPILNERLQVPAELPVVTDEYLDSLVGAFVEAAGLAYECGYDGVDIKACHRYLMSELLSAYNRPGKYGGSYENRTRLMRDVTRAVGEKFGGLMIIGSRFGVYDAIPYPYGFGWNTGNPGVPDLSESEKLLRELMRYGLSVIDITMGTPYYNPHVNRPYSTGGYPHPEHPLAGVERLIRYTGELKQSLPELMIIGTGYSYLGENAANVGAGVIEAGMADAVGFGRMAFAYPDFARDMLDNRYDRRKACLTCGKCTMLMRAHTTTGCPMRDADVYLPIYKEHCMKS